MTEINLNISFMLGLPLAPVWVLKMNGQILVAGANSSTYHPCLILTSNSLKTVPSDVNCFLAFSFFDSLWSFKSLLTWNIRQVIVLYFRMQQITGSFRRDYPTFRLYIMWCWLFQPVQLYVRLTGLTTRKPATQCRTHGYWNVWNCIRSTGT